MLNDYLFILIAVAYALLTFFMRDQWSWREWPVYRYGAIVAVTLYGILLYANDYDLIAGRRIVYLDDALPLIMGMLCGMIAGLVADIVVRMGICHYTQWQDEKPLRDFFEAQALPRLKVDIRV